MAEAFFNHQLNTPAPQMPDSPESPTIEFPPLDCPPPPNIPLESIDIVMEDLEFLEAREEIVKDLQSPERAEGTLKDIHALIDGLASAASNEDCMDINGIDTTADKCWSLEMGGTGPMVTRGEVEGCQNETNLTAKEALGRACRLEDCLNGVDDRCEQEPEVERSVLTVQEFLDQVCNFIYELKQVQSKEKRALKCISEALLKALPILFGILRFSKAAFPELPEGDRFEYHLKRLRRMAEQNAQAAADNKKQELVKKQ